LKSIVSVERPPSEANLSVTKILSMCNFIIQVNLFASSTLDHSQEKCGEMKVQWGKLIDPLVKRRAWIQRVLVTAVAASIAWVLGNHFVPNGGLVAAIAATLSVRMSLNKSISDGFGQLLGTAVGVGTALIAVHFLGFGVSTVFFVVILSLIASKVLRLREVASINVVITAMIVIGPGLAESTAIHRTLSTLIGTAIAILLSYFANPNTPAGRTVNRMTVLAHESADLLGEMSESVAAGYTPEIAATLLTKARLLVEEIPSLRAQSLEARSYVAWVPTARKDEVEDLYERGVALEHMMVQVRTISRTLFDMSFDEELPPLVTEKIAYALSCASMAIAQEGKTIYTNQRRLPGVSFAIDLRIALSSLAEEFMEGGRKIKVTQYVRGVSLVSNFERIANSLDLDSPAITQIQPEELMGLAMLTVSPLVHGKKIGGKFLRIVPKGLRRAFNR
jgi:uncharacterized membrane protein YgaE (UPF0421/DUF939 family)